MESSALPDDPFWRGKKVFLTGHSGFKGGWLTLWLTLMGAKVTGYSLPPNTKPSMFAVCGVQDVAECSLFGDIREYQQLERAMKDAAPDIVFHLAAQPLVRHSYVHPVETYQTNVMGTVNLLEAMRQIRTIRAAIIVTTDKCYENTEQSVAFSEDDPMGGHDPYSSSKGCAEIVVSAYQRSFFSRDTYPTHGVAIATARAGNVIGGGDWSVDRLVPDALAAFQTGQYLSIRNPNAIRPWQHVLDPLAGYLVLAKKLFESGVTYNGAWNFGPDPENEKRVVDVISSLASAWGPSAKWRYDEAIHAHEARFLKLDCSKAHSQLDWRPQYPLEIALQKTVEWHLAASASKNMREFSNSQIAEYRLSHSSN